MAELSRFYGIVIAIYTRGEERHGTPHVHAWHDGKRVPVSIETGEIIAGASSFAPRAAKMVREWILLHREELGREWHAAQEGQQPWRIEPLK